MYNIDEQTNSITEAVLTQGKLLKEANKTVLFLKRVLGIPDNQPISDEIVQSLEGKVISIKNIGNESNS